MHASIGRRWARIAVLVCGGMVAACGARTELASSDPSANDAGIGPHPLCASAGGVRLCGGDPPCPELPPPVCKGVGCQRALDALTGAPSAGGACLADVPDYGNTPCNACRDGEACLMRGSGELVCVPLDVCHALWDIGVRNVCRYSDKSAFDDRPIAPPPTACPELARSLPGALCGGACGDCTYPLDRCSGRSPTRPYGICNRTYFSADIATCSIGPSGVPSHWCNATRQNDYVCVVYKNGTDSVALGKRYGSCLPPNYCLAFRTLLGFDCYDSNGQIMP